MYTEALYKVQAGRGQSSRAGHKLHKSHQYASNLSNSNYIEKL